MFKCVAVLHLTTSHNISQLKQIHIYLEASWNHLTVRRKHLGCDSFPFCSFARARGNELILAANKRGISSALAGDAQYGLTGEWPDRVHMEYQTGYVHRFPSYSHHITYYMDLMGIWWEYSGIYLEVMGRSYGESPFIYICAIFHSKLLNNQRLDAVGNLDNQYWIIYTTMILMRFT